MSTVTVQMAFADTDGDVQALNAGTADNGAPIYFELNTQELEFGNRAHWKDVADQLVVFGNNLAGSELSCAQEDGDFKPIPVVLDRAVVIGQDVAVGGRFLTFRWSGTSDETTPVFLGFYLCRITDAGMVKAQ